MVVPLLIWGYILGVEEREDIKQNGAETFGMVYESRPIYKKFSKRNYRYEFYYQNKKYTGTSTGYISDNIENGNYYKVVFSSKNPEHSRMIFDLEYIQEIKTDKNGKIIDTIYIPKNQKIKEEINNRLNKCKGYHQIDTKNISDLYWKSYFDSVNNKEILLKGRLIDSLGKSPNELIKILNMRNVKPKIEFIGIVADTISIRIVNDEILTEQMGTTGAYCYLGETVFTLTENRLVNYVEIEMDPGSHASPGVYSRSDFKDLTK